MGMKYRKNKIKTEHSIIKGLRRFLEDKISHLDHVSGIIPGRIDVGRSTGEILTVSYKYPINDGAKLIARSGTSVQEVFVITSDPEAVKNIVEGSGK